MLSTRHITKKLTRTGTAALATLVLSSVFGIQAVSAKTLVTVNGTDISEESLQRYQQQRGTPSDSNPAQQRQAMLEELINFELIYQDALKNEVDKKDEFKKVLEKEIANMRKGMLANYMLRQRAETTVVTDDDLKKEYEKQKSNMVTKEFMASHILLESEKEAKDIIGQLDGGADFAKLAKEKSTGPSAPNGGDLGWFSPKQMVKPFSDAVASLDKDQYTKTPVKTDYGWHVILKTGSRETAAPAFADLKEQLRMRLKNKLVELYIGELRKGADIKRN